VALTQCLQEDPGALDGIDEVLCLAVHRERGGKFPSMDERRGNPTRASLTLDTRCVGFSSCR
jgi:hypothetical protein